MQLAPRYLETGDQPHRHSLAGELTGVPQTRTRMVRVVRRGVVSVPVGCGVWWPGLPLTLTGVALVPAAASVEARDR